MGPRAIRQCAKMNFKAAQPPVEHARQVRSGGSWCSRAGLLYGLSRFNPERYERERTGFTHAGSARDKQGWAPAEKPGTRSRLRLTEGDPPFRHTGALLKVVVSPNVIKDRAPRSPRRP